MDLPKATLGVSETGPEITSLEFWNKKIFFLFFFFFFYIWKHNWAISEMGFCTAHFFFYLFFE